MLATTWSSSGPLTVFPTFLYDIKYLALLVRLGSSVQNTDGALLANGGLCISILDTLAESRYHSSTRSR